MYNADIRVIKDAGKNKLTVNGVHQSSQYIYTFWNYAVEHLHVTRRLSAKKIVVFGVAGGTIIHILSTVFPKAQIVGVDIDAVMIELGMKYFGLRDIPNLRLITADARKFVRKSKEKYDVVVIDIYIARDLPDFLRDTKFLKEVRAMLSPHGYILMNYLRDGEYEEKVKDLEKKLHAIYSEVHHTNYLNNRFFLARK